VTVADSDALRSRRKRAHAGGDHSLCRRCDALGGPVALPASGDAPVDTRASLEGLARRLEAAHEADPGNDRVARELRATLMVLGGPDGPGHAADPLEDLRELARRVS
jgi:hypothetical protein